MDKTIPYLKKGDKIILISPAKAIEPVLVLEAKDFWEEKGFKVEIGEFALGREHYFSGNLADRLTDFQNALDDEEIKAIVCTRGGYGCIQLIDRINWSGFLHSPKWIVGFSDITIFHQHLQRFEFQSMHATMPLNYKENSTEALESLVASLSGQLPSYHLPTSSPYNQAGKANGRLIGGNLSILASLIGTDEQPDYSGSILFIEDLGEQLYHIDRMFYSLAKSGILRKIKGLIVGGMTDLKNTEIPFGKVVEEIISEHFIFQRIPILFNFPAGHITDNRALVLGAKIALEVDATGASIQYLQ